jgi:uncharacterized protein (TIGR02145 family)
MLIKRRIYRAIIAAGLFGLTSHSPCYGDITGIVTDASGTVPLSGAVVKLEKGNQAATTGADGKFTLAVSAAAFFPPEQRFVSPGLSATIHNGVLCVKVAEKGPVRLTVFDLNGKVLFTIRRTMNEGVNSLVLPVGRNGILLYRIVSGSDEVLLKGNLQGGKTVSAGDPIHDLLAGTARVHQNKTASMINDVITVTLGGYLNYRVIVTSSDVAGITIKMLASAGSVTDADGNVYQSVKIGKQVWTVENFRSTKYRDGSAIPLDTSGATWESATTPKYCYYSNMVNADSIRKFGALYNWYVVDSANVKKIAPLGWHVPADAEWDTLFNYLVANGHNWDGTKTDAVMAKSLAAKADWDTSSSEGAIGNELTKNNACGFGALPGGQRNYNGEFCNIGKFGYWLSTTGIDEMNAFSRDLCSDWAHVYRDFGNKSCGFSIRLVKDN